MKKVYIETLGCQMNKSDSERMLGMLEHIGYSEVKNPKDADFLIINTCSIRQLSEDKAYSRIGLWGKWKKSYPDLKIAMCGCVAQQDAKLVQKRSSYVDLVFGTSNIYELPSLVKRIENGEKVCAITDIPFKQEKDYKIKRAEGLNAWVPIMEGCNNFCTYCIVPYTRGRERSRLPHEILNEVKEVISKGYKEITLLGQNVDSYGKDLKEVNCNLSSLLKQINALEGDFRVRFVTSYPTDITDELIQTVKECDKLCEYFHIPMQSGNSEVLKKMNRRYNREQYFEIANKVRREIENVTITSDFIAGFPSETQEQFEDTLSAIEELELDYSNTASYSPRKGTVAAKWVEKYIPEDVKKERLMILNEKNKEASRKSNKKFIGKTMQTLVEAYKISDDGKCLLTGRTRNNKIIHFEGQKEYIGTFVNVKATEALLWCLKGEIV